MADSLVDDEAEEEGAEAAAEGRTAILYLELSMSETLATRLRKTKREGQNACERRSEYAKRTHVMTRRSRDC